MFSLCPRTRNFAPKLELKLCHWSRNFDTDIQMLPLDWKLPVNNNFALKLETLWSGCSHMHKHCHFGQVQRILRTSATLGAFWIWRFGVPKLFKNYPEISRQKYLIGRLVRRLLAVWRWQVCGESLQVVPPRSLVWILRTRTRPTWKAQDGTTPTTRYAAASFWHNLRFVSVWMDINLHFSGCHWGADFPNSQVGSWIVGSIIPME